MRALLILALTAFLAFPAMAAFDGPGSVQQAGFKGPGTEVPVITVEQAKAAPDDAMVSLTGNIIEKITGKKDKYTFRDATGDILVDIDHKRFQGQEVTPATRIQIIGKVDKDFGEPVEIDVKRLVILNN